MFLDALVLPVYVNPVVMLVVSFLWRFSVLRVTTLKRSRKTYRSLNHGIYKGFGIPTLFATDLFVFKLKRTNSMYEARTIMLLCVVFFEMCYCYYILRNYRKNDLTAPTNRKVFLSMFVDVATSSPVCFIYTVIDDMNMFKPGWYGWIGFGLILAGVSLRIRDYYYFYGEKDDLTRSNIACNINCMYLGIIISEIGYCSCCISVIFQLSPDASITKYFGIGTIILSVLGIFVLLYLRKSDMPSRNELLLHNNNNSHIRYDSMTIGIPPSPFMEVEGNNAYDVNTNSPEIKKKYLGAVAGNRGSDNIHVKATESVDSSDNEGTESEDSSESLSIAVSDNEDDMLRTQFQAEL